jgi:L-seryl-tRNA(Ser) seleniumtransferase
MPLCTRTTPRQYISFSEEVHSMASPKQELLRHIPSVERLLQETEVEWFAAGIPRRIVVECVRAAVEAARKRVLSETVEERGEESLRAAILADFRGRLDAATRPHYRKVVNATGIVLHTALGRAVLPSRAIRQIQEELSGYSLVQVDVQTGGRSKRDERIEWLLQRLTGAEAATVVNNNAAATAIVLNTVAKNKEVIVSRGQLVEIGGSFRLPEVMAAAGAKLVEVGSTNKTHLRDYERAITENTAAILRVHPSNYKIVGFTAEVPLEELVRLAHSKGLILIDDVGAGPLVDFSRFGFDKEPTLPESVATGADLITSSADKLIGGSQGGIILGRAGLIQAIRKNPLARIVRVGKLTLAALEATLTLFLDEAAALREVPTLRMLCRPLEEIAEQAERIAQAVAQQVAGINVAVIDGFSQMGSGSLPGQNLPTRLAAVQSPLIEAGELALRLRRHRPPVFARIHQGQVLVDPRTLLDGEEPIVVRALVDALRASGP